MTSDTRAAFKAAWVALLETVTGITHVSLVQKSIETFTTDEYPVIRIEEMQGSTTFYLTSAATDIVIFELWVAVKPVDDTDDELSGYVEAISDLMNVNVQVSDTCDLCFKAGQQPPQEWESSGYKYAVLIYEVHLRRNF